MKQTMDGISGLADKECSLYFSIWVTPKILVLHSTVVPVYPVSDDTAGIGIFWSVLLYCKLWREHLFKISRELFF